MCIELKLIEKKERKNNEYYCYDIKLDTENDEQLKKLASTVRKCYTKLEDLRDSLPTDCPLNTDIVKQIINQRIPYWIDSRESRFQVVRSEFGEIICRFVLEDCFNIDIHLSRLYNKERPLLNTRGIDVLGIKTNSEPILILGEAKVSKDQKSPPGVVSGSDGSCLEKKVPELLDNTSVIKEELCYYIEHIDNEENRTKYIKMMIQLAKNPNNLAIIGVPFLLRDAECYTISDVGELLDYESSDRRKVRFIIVKIKKDVNNLSKKIYKIAREGE